MSGSKHLQMERGQVVAILQIDRVCKANVSGDPSEWPHGDRHEGGPHMSCCADFSGVYALPGMALGKGQFGFPSY